MTLGWFSKFQQVLRKKEFLKLEYQEKDHQYKSKRNKKDDNLLNLLTKFYLQ